MSPETTSSDFAKLLARVSTVQAVAFAAVHLERLIDELDINDPVQLVTLKDAKTQVHACMTTLSDLIDLMIKA